MCLGILELNIVVNSKTYHVSCQRRRRVGLAVRDQTCIGRLPIFPAAAAAADATYAVAVGRRPPRSLARSQAADSNNKTTAVCCLGGDMQTKSEREI